MRHPCGPRAISKCAANFRSRCHRRAGVTRSLLSPHRRCDRPEPASRGPRCARILLSRNRSCSCCSVQHHARRIQVPVIDPVVAPVQGRGPVVEDELGPTLESFRLRRRSRWSGNRRRTSASPRHGPRNQLGRVVSHGHSRFRQQSHGRVPDRADVEAIGISVIISSK